MSDHRAFNTEIKKLRTRVKELENRIAQIQWWEGIYDGQPLTKEQIVAELTDFRFVMNQVPIVYEEVTGGRMSKVNYYAADVIAEFNSHIEDMIDDCVEEALKEFAEEHGIDRTQP